MVVLKLLLLSIGEGGGVGKKVNCRERFSVLTSDSVELVLMKKMMKKCTPVKESPVLTHCHPRSLSLHDSIRPTTNQTKRGHAGESN